MARILDVYLFGALVGQLNQNDGGELGFEYAAAWLANASAIPLSQSLPLQREPFSSAICRGFFAGILPEEAKRELIAKNLGISNNNNFAMLSEIGSECAGELVLEIWGLVL